MTALTPPRTILLIEDDCVATNEIMAELAAAGPGPFEVESVRVLSHGLARLGAKGAPIDAILLALFLPDSRAIETFDKLSIAAPDTPILILGPSADEAFAEKLLARGAQDYLKPGHLDGYSLSRALRNAIERRILEDALYAEKERNLVTLNSIGDAVLCTTVCGKITDMNVVAEVMLGWHREEAIGLPLGDVFRIIDGNSRKPAQDPLQSAIAQDRTVSLRKDCILIRRDGLESPIEDSAAPFHDRAGRIVGVAIIFHDVSAARAMSREMTHSAQHDAITGLPNRLLFNERVTQSIASTLRRNRSLAVMFLDLDRFKYINDSLGHAVGDQLLRSVSKRLVSSVRASDTVSRQGGDEFVILLSEVAHPEDAAISAKKILLALAGPHSIAGTELHIDGSIGISLYPEDGESAETLIKNADTAMYHAKESGRNNFQFFKAKMNLKAVERQSLEASLRRALERNEFLLHYQSKVNLATGEITGVEALIRWQQPERGLVPPSQFVPVAEDCGLILPIGNWVLREACSQARAWQDAGLPTIPVAVNVSGAEFRGPALVEHVKAILSETGLEARYLQLELTEGVLMDHAESTATLLHELKSMGLQLAVDDFGTGYSSLSYLKRFPIDVLKIDQSFVNQISSDPDHSSIVNAIIDMGKNLKLRLVAEGIETDLQRNYLMAQGCLEGQGYLFSRPVPAAHFAQLLKSGARESAIC